MHPASWNAAIEKARGTPSIPVQKEERNMPVLFLQPNIYSMQSGTKQRNVQMEQNPLWPLPLPLLQSVLLSPERAFWHDWNRTGKERFCC